MSTFYRAWMYDEEDMKAVTIRIMSETIRDTKERKESGKCLVKV